MKRFLKGFSKASVGLFFVFLILYFIWFWLARPLPGEEVQAFVVPKGDDLSSVSLSLEKKGIIRSAFAFKIWMLSKGESRSIQAGSFRLQPGMDFVQILQQFLQGTEDVWVTFLEGWRTEEFALELIEQGFEIDLATWRKETTQLEGFLFPDTYLFPKSYSQEEILAKLRETFTKKVTKGLENEIKKMRFSLKEIVTLASLVEREANVLGDRPIVAGILVKRWINNWPLQIDATVQYAKANWLLSTAKPEDTIEVYQDLDWWPKNITKKDLELDSAYNTYRNLGLPSGSICNPGLASIKAVLNYKETPYWFYLTDGQGKTHYAQDLVGHQVNINRYLR
ncbi:endolytic transglycosylase MltG [Patescibacteria group bacterium]